MNITFANDMIDSMCLSVVEPQATLHYFFRCVLHSTYSLGLLNDIYTLSLSLKNYSQGNLLDIFFYGAEAFTSRMNKEILKCILKRLLKKSDHFSGLLVCS